MIELKVGVDFGLAANNQVQLPCYTDQFLQTLLKILK